MGNTSSPTDGEDYGGVGSNLLFNTFFPFVPSCHPEYCIVHRGSCIRHPSQFTLSSEPWCNRRVERSKCAAYPADLTVMSFRTDVRNLFLFYCKWLNPAASSSLCHEESIYVTIRKKSTRLRKLLRKKVRNLTHKTVWKENKSEK
jgi:hypothetical protein